MQDWTESTDPSIRYFSGKAIYTNRITLDKLPQKALYLDLGKVMVMAKVKINGQYVGGVWTTPYRLPVGDFLRKGENLIEVEVVNNWRNRLIGDASLPEKERGTWTNVNPWECRVASTIVRFDRTGGNTGLFLRITAPACVVFE